MLVFPPGGFELAGDGPLEGFASQVTDQVCPVGLVGPGRHQGGGARVQAGDDQALRVPRRRGDCGVWTCPVDCFKKDPNETVPLS